MRDSDELCAVVTTFEPQESLLHNLGAIAPQVAHIFVVDDTGTGTRFPEAGLPENVSVISNTRNEGIAASLNTGIEAASARGFEWVLTLDDDTEVSQDYVSQIRAFYSVNQEILPKIGIVSLLRDDGRTKSSGPAECRCKRTLITSGSVCSVEVYRQVGGYSSEYFIDLVDFDFCAKVRKIKLQVVEILTIGMRHNVGNLSVKNVFWLPVSVYNHRPFRLYYQVRNSLLFFRKHVFFDPMLSFYLLLDIVRVPLKALLFEDQKLLRVRVSFRGLIDGILGRSGRIRP